MEEDRRGQIAMGHKEEIREEVRKTDRKDLKDVSQLVGPLAFSIYHPD